MRRFGAAGVTLRNAEISMARTLLFHAGLAGILLAVAAGPAHAGAMQLHWSSYLRDGPHDTARVIDEITRGTVIDVGACNRNWCRVKVEGATGYIDRDAISFPSPPNGQRKISGAQGCFWDKQYSFRTPDETQFCSIDPR